MARHKAGAPIDLARSHDLTMGMIAGMTCPEGKSQAFLRDTNAKGLRVRITAAGAKSYVFESKVNGKTLRRTLGDVRDMTIPEARSKAIGLRKLVNDNKDPRDLDRQVAEETARLAEEAAAQAVAAAALEAARALTVGEAWTRYTTERRPHWGDRTYADHLSMIDVGGRPRKRLSGVLTKPGPLAPIMAMRLVDLDAGAVEKWAIKESKDRPARVRLALRLLKAFLRWAAAESDFSDKVDITAASAKKAREAAGRARPKDDVLERGQLSAWFAAVRKIPNAVTAAYLQTLLLTGARPGEVLAIRWADLNTQWNSLTIRDKVEGERQIPLTPFVLRLLSGLPRRNDWVFSSTRTVSLADKHVIRRERYHTGRGTTAPEGTVVQVSQSGRLVEPAIAHRQACAVAGLDGLTLHGLRRSFASLTEWLEVPAGVVAQLQGHKPSATAEKHYKRRPLDLLRVHHERIEAWILSEAGIEFTHGSLGADGLRLATRRSA